MNTYDHLVRSVVVVLVVALAFAGAVATAWSSQARSASAVAANGDLLASCLASPAAAVPIGDVTVRVAVKRAWGFWLAGRARGFSPGEPVLAWLFDPTWDSTPSCLSAGKATLTGAARAEAAVWYRAAAAGSYKLCLVGVVSGRTACGMLPVTLPK